MTLATHSVIAAAVTRPLMHISPLLVFPVAVATHYLADAIPHWDYSLHSVGKTDSADTRTVSKDWRVVAYDLGHIAFDGLFGIGAVALAIRPTGLQDWLFVLAAAIGGMLPDLLQGAYAIIKLSPLREHQKFHDWWHTRIKLGPYPLIGIPFQLLIFFLSVWFLR